MPKEIRQEPKESADMFVYAEGMKTVAEEADKIARGIKEPRSVAKQRKVRAGLEKK